jgi:hypothetical protein
VLSSSGSLHVYGPSATVNVASDMLMGGGILGAHITAATHSQVMVQGTADLGGTLTIDISGVTPANGSNWNLVTASGGITRMFENVVIENAPSLARGLQYRTAQVGNTARLEVGNTLILTVDRQSGMATIENAVGSAIGLASYAITSGAGTLLPGGLQSLNASGTAGTGWTPGPQTTSILAEQKHNSTFSLAAGQSVSLGNPYALGVLPANEDLNFQFTTTDGRVLDGIVEYTGAVNDFTLFVNPVNGQMAIGNLTPFIDTPELTGYAIRAAGGQLVPGNWVSFQDSSQAGAGWLESPGSSALLAETNLENSFAFTNQTLISLGAAFTPGGSQTGLEFFYTVAGETGVRQGTVSFGPIPTAFAGLVGDYNNDGAVDARDYVVWRNNVGTTGTLQNDPIGGVVGAAHYAQWKAGYGNTAGGGLQLTPQAVPEPANFVALIGGVAGLLLWKRRGQCAITS